MPDVKKRAIEFAQKFFGDEYIDQSVYLELSKSERRRGVASLFSKLSNVEEGHKRKWEQIIMDNGAFPRRPAFASFRVWTFKLVKRLFGTAFMIKLLERHEVGGIEAYRSAEKSGFLGRAGLKAVHSIIKDETTHEKALLREVESNKGSLAYINSIVLGLSDSLVEVLAAVVGIAALASSAGVVVAGGVIVGAAGTLSMAGGVYLASKSERIVEKAIASGQEKTPLNEPLKNAYYTGVFYFIGSLVPVVPFLAGFTGFSGIIIAILLDIIALLVASTVIAIVSDTSIRRRTAEMVAVTLGTAIVTIIIGTIARVYFGVAI
ncbi:MAG: VIT1/CCC1 transporter family protein [Candidatus Micrarchaeota archaeon]|nr:VIT1/CCC1 transporter family protein [Candidatus Micrarchaeota archaeon]